MSNQFKLAIAPYMLILMTFALADGEKETKFEFKLQSKRLSEKDWQERITGDAGVPTAEKIREVMLDITTGWRDQTLVRDEQDQPAPFCREALEALFSIQGVLELYIANYRKEVLAKVKN